MKNPIAFEIPKLVFDECLIVSDNMQKNFKKLRYGVDESFCEVSFEN